MTLKAHALTTLETLKSELGITDTSKDAKLQRIINAQSRRLASLMGRNVHHETGLVEKLPGHGTARLLLSRRPVLEITAIACVEGQQSTTIDESSYVIESEDSGFILRLDGLWDTRQAHGFAYEPAAGLPLRLYHVTYTGGWVTPQQAADDNSLARTLPDDIEEAVLALCAQAYKRGPTQIGIKSQKMLSTSKTYQSDNHGRQVPDMVLDVVEAYSEVLV